MENQTQEELETIETQHYVDMKNALEKLEQMPEFKLVILDGYMKDKALDAVSLLGEPAIKQRGERPDLMEDLVSISNLGYHFRMIKNLGASAEMDLADTEGPEVEE